MKLLNLFYAACAIRAAFKVASHITGNHAKLVKASHRAIHTTAHVYVYAEYHGYHILCHKDISITSYPIRHVRKFDMADFNKKIKDWLWQQIKLTGPCYNSVRYTTALYLDGDPVTARCEKMFYNSVRRRFPYQSAKAMIRQYPELTGEINQIMYWFNRFDPVGETLEMREVDLIQ